MGFQVLWLNVWSVQEVDYYSAKGHVFGQTSTAGGECVGRGVDVVVFAGEAAERNGTESAS